MSATSFNGAVVMGNINGAIGGGVDAIFNGNNLLKGLATGAVIGGVVGGISYSIKYVTTSNTESTSYMEASDENIVTNGTPVGSRSYARDLYNSQFENQNGLSSSDIYNRANPGGTMDKDMLLPKNRTTFLRDLRYDY